MPERPDLQAAVERLRDAEVTLQQAVDIAAVLARLEELEAERKGMLAAYAVHMFHEVRSDLDDAELPGVKKCFTCNAAEADARAMREAIAQALAWTSAREGSCRICLWVQPGHGSKCFVPALVEAALAGWYPGWYRVR